MLPAPLTDCWWILGWEAYPLTTTGVKWLCRESISSSGVRVRGLQAEHIGGRQPGEPAPSTAAPLVAHRPCPPSVPLLLPSHRQPSACACHSTHTHLPLPYNMTHPTGPPCL